MGPSLYIDPAVTQRPAEKCETLGAVLLPLYTFTFRALYAVVEHGIAASCLVMTLLAVRDVTRIIAVQEPKLTIY